MHKLYIHQLQLFIAFVTHLQQACFGFHETIISVTIPYFYMIYLPTLFTCYSYVKGSYITYLKTQRMIIYIHLHGCKCMSCIIILYFHFSHFFSLFIPCVTTILRWLIQVFVVLNAYKSAGTHSWYFYISPHVEWWVLWSLLTTSTCLKTHGSSSGDIHSNKNGESQLQSCSM